MSRITSPRINRLITSRRSNCIKRPNEDMLEFMLKGYGLMVGVLSLPTIILDVIHWMLK